MRNMKSLAQRVAVACAVVPVVVVSACGSSTSSGQGGSDGLPSSLELTAIQDLTGVAGFAGVPTREGAELALDEINDTKFLGDTKLSLKYSDTGSKPGESAALATKAVSSSTPILLGPLVSTVGQVMSPILERGKLPTIYTQMSADGVNIGPYTYRATTPGAVLFEDMGTYLDAKGIKTVSTIFASDNDSGKFYGESLIPGWSKKFGMQLKSQTAVLTSTTDFTALATKVVKENPDAIGVLLVGGQYPAAIKQIRGLGYKGLIFAAIGACCGTLTPIGSTADGVIWPSAYVATDDAAQAQGEVGKNFLALYKKKFGADRLPSNFHADGYDSMWLIARVLKDADSTDRAKVLASLEKITKAGYEGSIGDITFEKRDQRSKAVIAEWRDGKETIAQ